MDLLHQVLKAVDRNRWLVTAALVGLAAGLALLQTAGCRATTAGIIAPNHETAAAQVDRETFIQQAYQMQGSLAEQRVDLDAAIAKHNAQVQAFNDRVEAGLDNLDRQDQVRRELLDLVGLAAQQAAAGNLDLSNMIIPGLGLLGMTLGLGASADNRRKDKIIDSLRVQQQAASTSNNP